MTSIKLLRVERVGKGMYNTLWHDCDLPYGDNRHPSPHEDTPLSRWWMKLSTKDSLFAFGSPQQFLQWVYDFEWRYKMQELGGELWVYEIELDGCAIGEKQAIFNINSVISKRPFPITGFDDAALRPIIEEYLQS